MKKNNFILLITTISLLIGGGYFPNYGPGEDWTTIESTSNAFIIFDNITINSEEIEYGDEGGVSGSCDGNDCDILGAIYNGICVGWTYAPLVNGGVTLGIQLNDALTAGIENYPSVNAAFRPTVTFNLFDASEGVMYYNIASSPLQLGTAYIFGPLNITGDGTAQSNDGFQFGEPIVFPLGDPVCNTISGDNGEYINFSSFGGGGDENLCGYAGCMDISAENFDNLAVEDDGSCEYAGCTDPIAVNYNSGASIDDDSCGYSGCNDPTAGNFVENGENYSGQLYDCSGNAGIFDMSCCQFMGCNDAEATNYVSVGSDCSGVPDGSDESCCTYSPADISTSISVIEETFDSNNYSTSSVELSWSESNSCAGGTEWSYVVCLEDVVDCDSTTSNSIVYDIGWNNSIEYTLYAFGCALDIYGELYGTSINGTLISDERPTPTIPSTPVVLDNSGEGFVELEWEESYQADYYSIVFRNILNAEDEIEFKASNDSTDIILNNDNGNLSAIFYPLGEGKTYQAQISARNINSLSEEQSSSYSTFSENIDVLDFPVASENGFMAADTIPYPYSVELTWEAAPNYGTYPLEWMYEIIQTGVGTVFSTNETTALITGLQTLTQYEFQINAISGYGEIESSHITVSTTADGDGPEWGFQILVSHLGYGYMPVYDENNFFGFAEEASNHYDNALDIVEPPTAADYVKFYFVREDWEEEQIGWGSHYTQEIRSRHDDDYAKENSSEDDLAVFNGQLISNMPGFTTLKFDLINFYGDAPVNSDDDNFCPVYLKIMAFDDVNYYKIEDETELIIQINGLTEYNMELIVGNLIPDAIPNFVGEANNTHEDPLNIRPEIDLSWVDHDNCEVENGVEVCNSISSRYPPTGYLVEFNDGTLDVEYDDDIFTHNHAGISNLSYETNYEFTISGINNSGKGISTQIEVETSNNLSPIANAGGYYDEDCVWDEYGCGNTYKTPHDGNPNSSIVEVTLHGSGYDPEGLGLRFYWNQLSGDSSATLNESFSIQSLIDSAFHEPTFEAGLSLDSDPLVYEFELSVSDTFPLGLTQFNGYDIDKDTVTITILPESNQFPVSFLDVTRTYDESGILLQSVDFICMAGDTIIYNYDENTIITNQDECELTDGEWVQHNVNDFLNWNWEAENEIGPIWEVPHDGDPNTNFANIQIVNKSYDLDGGEGFTDDNGNEEWDEGEAYNDINSNGMYDEQLDEIFTLWNRTTPPETYIDANGNDQFDYGEPFNDLNNNGYYDWSEAINLDTLTTRSTPGVDTVQIFIEDSYGFKDTSQMIIYILDEPNETPVVYAGNDTIIFIEPEYESTYNYICTDPNSNCYPSVADADNDGSEIVDTLNYFWQDGSTDLEKVFVLPEGNHDLTLCAIDPYSAQDCDTKIITIYQEPLPDKIDNFETYQDLYFIELSWNASDLNNLSEEYSSLGYDDFLLEHIEIYPHNYNASHYEIYRNDVLLEVVERNDINQMEFKYVDNGLNPSNTYSYKIIPMNSHDSRGVESEVLTVQTTDVPTIRITSPNGTEIWASSYFDENLEEVIKAFPLTWEMTSIQNIRKINIFVSHDNGETWEQAENFYAKNAFEVCSYDGISVAECESTGLGGSFNNPMSCEAMGNNWVYGAIDSCFAQLKEVYSYSEFISSQDLAVQIHTNDDFAISPQISFSSDTEPLEIFNQGDIINNINIVSDETYIKGEGIEINHNTLVKMVLYDRGDYYDVSGETPPNGWESSINTIEDVSDGSFTLSSNKVTRIFDIGWHLFGTPVQPYIPRMFDAFQEPHGFGDWAFNWIAFAQSGSFNDLYMQMGQGYYLNNTSVGNLTIYGEPVTNNEFFDYTINDIINNNYSIADIKIQKGWNLISNTLVRPISKFNFEVIHLEDNSNYTFDQAVNYGFIQPSVYGFEGGYYTTNSIYPFEGYFWHAARGDMLLKIRPHDFNQLSLDNENDFWQLSLNASLDGINYNDKVIIGMSEDAQNGFKYGEDEVELPKFLGDNPIDLTIEENWIGQEDLNGNIAESQFYYSNIKKLIIPDQSQIWKVNFRNEYPELPINLTWNFDQLDEAIDIKMYFEGKSIDMRVENNIELNSHENGSFIIIIGKDPLLSNLGIPLKFGLGKAYPNPFNPTTQFKLELNKDGLTNIHIYNVAGQLIEEIHSGFMKAGYHQITWHAPRKPSGLYVVKVNQGENIATQKILLIK